MTTGVIKVAYRCCFLAVLLVFLAASIQAQDVSAADGRWVWKAVARRNKPQTQFTVDIHREGNVILGTYSVDEFINGEWQGEDGNQTPFRGQVTSAGVQIEFDPSATAPGYELNVVYKAPEDGRKPSVAVLALVGRTLVWRLVSGARIEGVAARLTLRRVRNPRRGRGR